MVLGLRSKSRRPSSLQADVTVHIVEIKPWPPSQSLKSLKSVVLQWENGDRSSGSTRPVAPSPSKIEFNESFNLRVTLVKDGSGRGSGFQRNVLELSLYEPRRDKAAKGQLLGSAAVDLAEHGVLKNAVSFGVPLSCKRSYRNTLQPVVYVKIQPGEKESSSASSSFRESLSKEEEAGADKDGSVSALMSEEYAEEAEIASFTDDDVSSHSSVGNLASAPEPGQEQCKDEPDAETENKGAAEMTADTVLLEPNPVMMKEEPTANGNGLYRRKSLAESFSGEIFYDSGRSENGHTSLSTPACEKLDAPTSCTVSSPIYPQSVDEDDSLQKVNEKVVALEENTNVGESETTIDHNEILKPVSTTETGISIDDKRALGATDDSTEDTSNCEQTVSSMEEKNEVAEEKMEVPNIDSVDLHSAVDCLPDDGFSSSQESSEHTPVVRHKYLLNALRKPVDSASSTSSQSLAGEKGSRTLTSDRLRNMQTYMRSPPHSFGSSGSLRYASSNQFAEDVKEIDVQESEPTYSSRMKHAFRSNVNSTPNNRIRDLGLRVERLERELTEAACAEISIYSIVAEHGRSMQKVHTPARRLSRLYIHASKELLKDGKASAARSIVTGLILAAKACGNDVPRLTFWLSNSIVLRTIVSGAGGHSDISNKVSSYSTTNGSRSMSKQKTSPLKWEPLHHRKESDDWQELSMFTAALERTESWIFSRIIESIWWQTLTPHMQCTDERSESPKGTYTKMNFKRKPRLGDKKHESFSIEVWKKAFRDACSRLCPLRAEGHDCGCLPMLPRLVMEQCVARLDVAMFNAILRESEEEIPTDPVSDPISDPKVLPIPPGKSSFGAGAQLKNAIGNWSRWLTDLFGMDIDESSRYKNEQDDERIDIVESFKSFRLLNALSDLLMLPKDMLLEKSIRKEVCPTFSSSIIKRILEGFSPDEFCPDVIPNELFDALDSEDPVESSNEEIRQYPCTASPVSYSPPLVASVENIIGDVQSLSILKRSRSSVLRKCHTSDDELDELDSPLTSIVADNSFTPYTQLKRNNNPHVLRYQLLHNVWRNDD